MLKLLLLDLVELELGHGALLRLPLLLLVVSQEVVEFLVFLVLVEAWDVSFLFLVHEATLAELFLADCRHHKALILRCKVQNVELIRRWVLNVIGDRAVSQGHQILELVFMLHLSGHFNLFSAIIDTIVELIAFFFVILPIVLVATFLAIITHFTVEFLLFGLFRRRDRTLAQLAVLALELFLLFAGLLLGGLFLGEGLEARLLGLLKLHLARLDRDQAVRVLLRHAIVHVLVAEDVGFKMLRQRL